MILRNKEEIKAIKGQLVESLKREDAFWSYSPEAIAPDGLTDEQLAALTMRYLDLDEIDLLYRIYPASKIKAAWKDILVPEGDYLYTLNRFLAWYYFKSKSPDSYLKSLQTRYLNRLLS